MARVVLKNVKKIYREKRKSKKEYEQEQNLQITKDGVVAVQDFNLEIEDKEFIVLVGPSGCGKSTTLRMIAGLEEITSGELYIGDQLMNDVEPKDRNIAMVFQNYALYPHMSASENISFTLKLHKFDKPTTLEKIKGAAKTLDINGLLDRRPKELSGGQRQRIAIGRAIVREPQVLLMDEPLSNLDAKLRNQMRTEIINLRNTIKSTFVYVTHDQIEAMTLGDRIVVMKDGFIQQIGTPQYVYNNPENLFVAGFIGTPQMNFFDAKLLIKDKEYYVDIDGFVIKLPEDKQAILIKKETPEQDIILGVRPNYIYNDSNGIKGIVTILEMMGAETHVHIDVNGKSVIEILSTKDGVKLNKGDSVKINFDKEDIHIFSRETENNLAI